MKKNGVIYEYAEQNAISLILKEESENGATVAADRWIQIMFREIRIGNWS